MARKVGIKGDPLASVEAPSVMEGILERNRERTGRPAPEVSVPTEPPVEAVPSTIDEEPPKTSFPGSELPSYRVTELPNTVTKKTMEAVIARSNTRGQGQVQTGVRVPAGLYDRLEDIQHRLRRQGVTRQGILTVGLERILDQLEEELQDT